MKKSWKGVQKEYPEILCLGCGSHMTNLLVEDIMKVPKLHQHFEAVKEVNRYWKNSGVLNGLLKATAKEINQKFVALQLPGKTRWQGKLYTVRSNISNIKAMQRAILDQRACQGDKPDADAKEKYNRIRNVILDEQYWVKTKELEALLTPFLQVIISLETNKPKLSRLYAYYTFLLKETATLSNSLLTRSEAHELINQRFKKLYHPLMTIAYLCDPVARDKRPIDVTDKQIKGVRGWLLEYYKNNKKKTATVYAELLKLRARLGPFSRPLN